MITLLEKYHAYAPPFKYEAIDGTAYIGGIEGRVPWTADLENQLRAAWDVANKQLITKEFKLPSAHRAGVVYTVRKILNGWTCTCPARTECWHVKYAKQIDLVQTEDDEDFVKRVNDYRTGVED